MHARTKTFAGAAVVVLGALLVYRFTSSSDAPPRPAEPAVSAHATSSTALAPTPSEPAEAPEPSSIASNDAAVDAASDPHSRRLLTASWGSGLGKLGRDRPAEGNPEGPMSLVLAGRDLLVLDQVNGRLARYDAQDGRLKGTTNAPTTAQDLAVGKDGTVAMIDRLVDKSVILVDANGKKIGELPLGARLPEPGLVTAVVIDGKDVYAEKEHGALVLLGSTDGTPASDAAQLAGRPTRDGALLLTAGISSKSAGRAYLNGINRATTTSKFAVQVSFPRPSLAIVLLDSDAKGTIYLGVAAGEPATATIACLSGNDGHVLGRVTLPLSDAPEESFRDFTVGDDGSIVFAVRDEEGVEYRTATCPQ